MADFKDKLSPELIQGLGRDLSAAWVEFDRARFERMAGENLVGLEMKARIQQIARALCASMPADLHTADEVIRAALDRGALQGWASLPVNEYVADTMLECPDIGLPLLAGLTPRYTAEFAIRHFIEAQYEPTMAYLRAWVDDPDEHVRRLVSEGTRPRLPWGQRLARFIADPGPALELLEGLVNDESLYVRRSVANSLNDIAKDHPAVVLETARRWAANSTRGDYVVRHGLRTLIKRGDPEALRILGFDPEAPFEITGLKCSHPSIPIGGETTIAFTLRATAATNVAIDYVVHFQGAHGPKAGRVFKLSVRDLPAGKPVTFVRRHRFATVATRRIHPGPHLIELQVNGRVLGTTVVDIFSPTVTDTQEH